MPNTKNVDSNELQTFIQDVRDDLNNLDSLIDYYDFLGHHKFELLFSILKTNQVFLKDL